MCNVLLQSVAFTPVPNDQPYQSNQTSVVYYVFFLLANKIITDGLSSVELIKFPGFLYGFPDSLVERYLVISSHLQKNR